METITVDRAATATDEVRALIGELDAELMAEYAPEQRHGLALDAIFEPHVRFFVARLDGAAVGCGGVALFDDFAEVKRMYVRPQARGHYVADALLLRITMTALDAGLGRLCLETGVRQAAAIRCYEKWGFRRCEPFGAYATMPPPTIAASVFFEKPIKRYGVAGSPP